MDTNSNNLAKLNGAVEKEFYKQKLRSSFKSNDLNETVEAHQKMNNTIGVYTKNFLISSCKPGTLCLGMVKKIEKSYVILETENSIELKLCSNMISMHCTEALANERLTLDRIFEICQMIPVKVVKGKERGCKINDIIVTSIPRFVNSHITVNDLDVGCAIVGVFEKIVDNDFIVDLGLTCETKGKIPCEYLTKLFNFRRGIIIGQPYMFSIKKMGSIIELKEPDESNFATQNTFLKINIEKMIPGTVFECTKIREDDSAIYVTYGCKSEARIYKHSIPKKIKDDLFLFGTSIKAILTVVDPESKSFIANINDQIIRTMSIPCRKNLGGYNLGKKIISKIKFISRNGFTFEFPSLLSGRSESITAFMEKKPNCDYSGFNKGDQMKLVVIDVQIFKRRLIVKNDINIYDSKNLGTYKDGPGARYSLDFGKGNFTHNSNKNFQEGSFIPQPRRSKRNVPDNKNCKSNPNEKRRWERISAFDFSMSRTIMSSSKNVSTYETCE
uniref:S1 motif domain-containing protein n=1 Tax=Parastrongyloides trichosuri TaxID=131310 RepID=A0A0N4ZE88_PARTI